MFRCIFKSVENAIQVDIDNSVPLFLFYVIKTISTGAYACIGETNIDAAVILKRLTNSIFDFLLIGYITLEGGLFSAVRFHLF